MGEPSAVKQVDFLFHVQKVIQHFANYMRMPVRAGYEFAPPLGSLALEKLTDDFLNALIVSVKGVAADASFPRDIGYSDFPIWLSSHQPEKRLCNTFTDKYVGWVSPFHLISSEIRHCNKCTIYCAQVQYPQCALVQSVSNCSTIARAKDGARSFIT